jgi:hypothetical protein
MALAIPEKLRLSEENGHHALHIPIKSIVILNRIQ